MESTRRPVSASVGKADVRLLFWSDAHLADRPPGHRSATYADDLFVKMGEVKALARDVDASIFGGDLLHIFSQPRDVSHALVRRTIQLLRDWPTPLYIVRGNHDGQPGQIGLNRWPLGVVLEALRDTDVRLLDDEMLYDEDGLCAQVRGAHWFPSIDSDPSAFGIVRREGVDWTIVAAHGMLMPLGEGYPFPCVTMDQVAELIEAPDLLLVGHTHWETTPVKIGHTLFAGPGSIARVSRTDTEMARQVQVAIVTATKQDLTVEFVPLRSMRPAADVFTWSEPGVVKTDGLFEGYVSVLESGLQVEGLSVEDALMQMEKQAPEGVAARAMEYLRSAGL